MKAGEPALFGIEGVPSRPGLHRFAHEAMATVFEVHCAHEDLGYARQAAHAAFDLVDLLERQMSRFVANSDVSRINVLEAGETTRVSPSTLECLEIARRMFDLTAGAFDVSIGTGLGALDLVRDEFTVAARIAGVRLDLGGIGKGYAVDRMAELLEEWEIRRALVHGGFSSVLALEGPPDEDGWPLTLSAPEPGGPVLARLSARQKALSASGTLKGDHILDPRTGHPVRNRAVWVAVGGREEGDSGSPSAIAEALSTAFMVLSPGESAETCRRLPGVEAWLVEGPSVVHLAAEPRAAAPPKGPTSA